jgi:hypothetical protein
MGHVKGTRPRRQVAELKNLLKCHQFGSQQ